MENKFDILMIGSEIIHRWYIKGGNAFLDFDPSSDEYFDEDLLSWNLGASRLITEQLKAHARSKGDEELEILTGGIE